MGFSPTELSTAVIAIGALGTAAYGLVDASKVFSSVSSSGLTFIRDLLQALAPEEKGIPMESAITRRAIFLTLQANWLNGKPMADLKASTKTLIKLRLNPDTAPHLAQVTGVAPAILAAVAAKLTSGLALSPEEMNVYGRFDVLLSTMIDRAYERADQRYRNTAKSVASIVAVLLAEVTAVSLALSNSQYWNPSTFIIALIAGLLATPLAPIAKDLSTSINNAAKAVQTLKK
jgi:hypothetical protein